MKKFLLFALPLFLFSCKSGVEAHRVAIEKLGTDWDAATNAVTGFSDGLTKDLTGYTEMASSMMLDSAAVASLKGDAGKNGLKQLLLTKLQLLTLMHLFKLSWVIS
ncbi:MAG: hypothetical protein IPO48_13080 [Saprospiraceae bacterium]|nr:hypothetical protein [Saprospiraceae bacterium]